MKYKISVAIVDDHDLFRKGLVSLLKEFEEISILIQATNGQDLLSQLKNKQPHVILLDIEMPIMDGIEAVAHVRQKYPNIKVIMLTQHYDEQMIYHLMEKGAHGFLPKNADIEIVVDAIYAVIEKGYYYSDSVSKAMITGATNKKTILSFHSCNLSEREIEVVRLICKQMTIREIADTMCLSPRTIETYRENIYLKTDSKNTVGVAFYAMKHKLLD